MKKYIKIPDTDNKELKIMNLYDKGGYSYLSGTSNERGYYIIFRVMEVQKLDNGIQIEQYAMFGEAIDFKILYKKVDRANKKTESELEQKILNINESEALQNYLSGNKQYFFNYFGIGIQ